jgi:hypothetical protein
MADLKKEVRKFIEDLYSTGCTYRHVFAAPGAIKWASTHIAEILQGRFVHLVCSCKCNDTPHEHGIFEEFPFAKKTHKSRQQKAVRYVRRIGETWPSKLNFATAKGDRSHLMNKVLYILGTTSKNYSNGWATYKPNGHWDHIHPFSSLPPEELLDELREEMVDEDPVKKEEKRLWLIKQERDREKRKTYCKAHGLRFPGSNRVAKRLKVPINSF